MHPCIHMSHGQDLRIPVHTTPDRHLAGFGAKVHKPNRGGNR